MSTRVGRVIAHEGGFTVVEFDSSCGTCRGCNQQQAQSLQLPGSFSNEVAVSVDLKSQAFALVNSLLIPILMAVISAFVADWLLLGEPLGIFVTFCCFILGMLLCRPLGLSALGVVQGNRDE
jgi:hypothetical protein